MVEITNKQELEAWLDTQPKEVSVMIASRAALRVLPLLNDLPQMGVKKRDKIVLPVFRAMAISWVVMGYSLQSKSIVTSAIYYATVDSVVVDFVADAAYYVADFAAAAYYAIDTTNAIDTAAVNSVVSAAFATSDSATIYKSVSHDATQIKAGKSVKEMMLAPLWSDERPEAVMKNWQQLKLKLLVADENWQVWTEWYEARLLGTPKPIEKLEIARANIDDALWQQGSKVVNAHIQTLIEDYTPKAKADLSQGLASYQFLAKNGKIYAAPLEGDPTLPEMAEDLRAGLKKKAQAFQERSASLQIPRDVASDLDELLEVLGDHIDDVRPGQLLDISDSLEADLLAYDSEEGRAQLIAEAFAKLKKLLKSLTRLKGCFPDIVDLEAITLAQNMTRDKGAAFMAQSEIIVKHAKNDRENVDANAVEALESSLPLIKKLEDKAKFSMDEEVRAKAWKDFGFQVAKHSLNVRNYISERLRILRDEAEVGTQKLSEHRQRISGGYKEDLKQGGNKAPTAAGIGAFAGGIGLLISP